MVPSGEIYVDQRLIVEGAGAHLVVAGGQKLDHVIPVCLVLGLHIFQADLFQLIHNGLHIGLALRCQMVMAEII